MGFLVAQKDIERVNALFSKTLPQLKEQISAGKKAINDFYAMPEFKGHAAEGMKAYMREVHGMMLAHIDAIASSLQEQMDSYRKGIYQIESQTGFSIPEDQVENCKEDITKNVSLTQDTGLEINKVFDSVSSIVPLQRIDSSAVFNASKSIKNIISNLCKDINNQEKKSVATMSATEEYLNTLTSNIDQIGVGPLTSVSDYTSGTLAALPWVRMLNTQFNRENDYIRKEKERKREETEVKGYGIAISDDYRSIMYKGEKYQIYVPDHMHETIDGHWNEIDRIVYTEAEIDIVKAIQGAEWEDDLPSGYALSYGILSGLNAGYCDRSINIVLSTNAYGNRRAVIYLSSNKTKQQFGELNYKLDYTVNYSEKIKNASDGDKAARQLYTKYTGKELLNADLFKVYDVVAKYSEARITSDALSYLSYDEAGRLQENFVWYAGESLEIHEVDAFSLIANKKTRVIDLTKEIAQPQPAKPDTENMFVKIFEEN